MSRAAPAGGEGPEESRDGASQAAPGPSPLRQVIQPFVDLTRAPRALWGINLSYLIEGMVYFGIVMLLSGYFTEVVGLSEVQASPMVGVLTFGITLSMVFFGGLADRWGVRVALFCSIALMLVGRLVLTACASAGLAAGWLGPLHLTSMLGILFVVLGYGMYQPAVYTANRQFTDEKTATMGYAMLYAVMNLGGWLPTFVSPPIRKAHGIVGVYWAYAGFTALTLLVTVALLSRRTVEEAIAAARAGRSGTGSPPRSSSGETKPRAPFSLWRWLRQHPLADAKFSYFIFCLIPVQTLFAHNWLTLPKYVERAYAGTWIGRNYEAATSFNSLLIFLLAPTVAALTQRSRVYSMMIWGTAVMALPTFLLALGPSVPGLAAFIVLMTIGEAIWQPRFLQYAAEIAPEGRSGAYMGVAQLPWVLTKLITSLYAGWFLQEYCPKVGPLRTERMWLIYALIAVSSTLLLLAARGWLGKDFKTRS
jgi:dipeptide/tripeptide permease